MALLSDIFVIIMDHGINAPGHVGNVVDGHNVFEATNGIFGN